MTREEAIGNLKYAIRWNDMPVKEAMEMAIKALEQENCEDCVSRQTVKEQMITYGFHAPDMTATEFVEGLSSVEQQPKTGHWIGHREHCEMNNLRPSELGGYFWCSECDYGIDTKEWHMNNYNFCPNCGAKMVEPQKSEE